MIIGITGGVGCGKSTVLDILYKDYDALVIEADKVAHKLMGKGEAIYNAEREHFGDRILSDNRDIDRKKLAEIIFSDEKELEWVNSLVHPKVKEYIMDAIKKNKDRPYIIIEAALLIEAGYTDICDKIWYIYTDKDTRIQRLLDNRGYTREKSEEIIANQLEDRIYREHSDYVIDNSNDIEDTKRQINMIMEDKNGRK